MDGSREFPKPQKENLKISPQVEGVACYEEVLMKQAYENMSKGDYETAANIFGDILRRFRVSLSDDQKSLINSELSVLYFWLGDYDSAERYCEGALAYGDNDQAYVILGKIAVVQFRFPSARGYFSKISEDNPARPLGLCLVCIKLRDIIGAEGFLKEASEKTSKADPEFRVYEIYISLLQGKTDFAVSAARAVKQKCERDPALMILIAEIFMTAGNYGEAVSTAEKVGMQAPENDQIFAIRGHAAYAEEDYAEADALAKEAVRLNPRNAYAKTILMKLAVRDGNYAGAEKIGTDILSDCPEYPLGHANLGDVYFNQGRYEMAEVEYEQTMQLMNSNTKGARLRQARMKFIKSEFADATRILEELIEFHHTYYDDAMCDLLLCYDKLGDSGKKANLIDKMEMRKSFYHRMEKLLKSFKS